MRRFKWIGWNEAKVFAHGLSPAEVEAAFNRVAAQTERRDGSVETLGVLPNGRAVRIVWRYDREGDEVPDVFGDLPEPAVFVITAY